MKATWRALTAGCDNSPGSLGSGSARPGPGRADHEQPTRDQPARAGGSRDLLGRFIDDRDEAAFAVLVERHGPVVLGLCRRVLRHAHDADDACQATFLVLARKAASLRKRSSLTSWLHGVAYRIAVNLKSEQARPLRREQRAE